MRKSGSINQNKIQLVLVQCAPSYDIHIKTSQFRRPPMTKEQLRVWLAAQRLADTYAVIQQLWDSDGQVWYDDIRTTRA